LHRGAYADQWLTTFGVELGGAARKPVAPKYRNTKTGETWSGRGRTPRWLAELEAQGKSRDDYRV